MCRKEEHRRGDDELHVNKLDGMDGRDGKGRRLFVSVVKFVEIFVQKGRMVHTMMPIR